MYFDRTTRSWFRRADQPVITPGVNMHVFRVDTLCMIMMMHFAETLCRHWSVQVRVLDIPWSHCPASCPLFAARDLKWSKHMALIKVQSESLTAADQLRSEIIYADKAEISQRSYMLTVGFKNSFLFRSSASEAQAKWHNDRCTYSEASVFERRQQFCEFEARSDGRVNLR